MGPIGRLMARFGRCPECGDRLVDELDGDLVSSWDFHHRKWAARMTGGLNRPNVHNVSMPACKRCDRCKRWYLGRWAYRRDG